MKQVAPHNVLHYQANWKSKWGEEGSKWLKQPKWWISEAESGNRFKSITKVTKNA